MKLVKTLLWIFGIIIVLFFILALFNQEEQTPDSLPDSWADVRANDIAEVLEEGWSAPQRLSVSDDGWEDSVWATRDGQTVYYMWYPGHLLNDVITGDYKDDVDIYRSDWPFTNREKQSIYNFDEDIWSHAGPFIDARGDFWYHSNREVKNEGVSSTDDDIYRNGELLLNSNEIDMTNPHYCVAKDELWFDNNDKKIWILKNAEANNFEGEIALAPYPLNMESNDIQDFQPWLNEDCDEMLFSSTRDGGVAIYKTTRTGDSWSEPVMFIKSKLAVGEASVAKNGNIVFFQHVFVNKEGLYNNDMFYIEKIE